VIRTGYVRVKTNHPEVSIQAMTLSPGGVWGLFQPHGNVFVYRFDDENLDIDTLICVINRRNQEDNEIEIETVWHDNTDPTTPIRRNFDSYYTETKLISARESVMGTMPVEEGRRVTRRGRNSRRRAKR
jgi:hypothetical protein